MRRMPLPRSRSTSLCQLHELRVGVGREAIVAFDLVGAQIVAHKVLAQRHSVRDPGSGRKAEVYRTVHRAMLNINVLPLGRDDLLYDLGTAPETQHRPRRGDPAELVHRLIVNVDLRVHGIVRT